MDTQVHSSSKSHGWSTPQDLFDQLDKEHNFQLDPCATSENAKCSNYFTKEDDGLSKDWYQYGSVFMNPPYGREIAKWVRKAWEESEKGCKVVCLLPVRTDTRWFHDYCYPYGRITFIKGRLKFGGHKNSTPFPSMIVIFGR